MDDDTFLRNLADDLRRAIQRIGDPVPDSSASRATWLYILRKDLTGALHDVERLLGEESESRLYPKKRQDKHS